jgi:hypothetical protein
LVPGRGPTPKRPDERRRRNSGGPIRGEWTSAQGVGWQHGAIPEPPDGLLPSSVEAWDTWFRGWVAAHWGPEDLPALHVLVGLYDHVERGKLQLAGELRHWMDGYGLTPKGRQDRRWAPPVKDTHVETPKEPVRTSRYAHLKIVDSDSS